MDPTQVFSAGIVPRPLSAEKRKGSRSKFKSSVKRSGNFISAPDDKHLGGRVILCYPPARVSNQAKLPGVHP